jgi:8-oxo-dGTP diphosphatase
LQVARKIYIWPGYYLILLRVVINAAVIQDKQLLLVRKLSSWILPGGKLEPGESDLECLSREVYEELSGTRLKDFRFYNNFYGKSPFKTDNIRVAVYFARIDGHLRTVRAGDSILESAWANYGSAHKLSNITARIMDDLRQENYL